MKITKALLAWLVKECGLDAEASEDEAGKAAAAALLEGKLSAEKMAELSKEEDDEEDDVFLKELKGLSSNIEKALEAITKKEEPKEKDKEVPEEKDKEESKEKDKEVHTKAKKPPMSKVARAVMAIGGFSSELEGDDTVDSRIKSAAEEYATEKTALVRPKENKNGRPQFGAGQRATLQGHPQDTSSEQDLALAGVWAKYQLLSVTPRLAGNPELAWRRLNDHEKSLLAYLTEETTWDFSRDEKPNRRKGYSSERGIGIKALIDDSTSGGLEAAPIVFDDSVIEAPLLYGELYPMVNEVPLDRGRRIEGVSTEVVTGSWGGVDDTAVSLFNTASYVAAFDTTIYRWEGSVRIGLDFLSDTPIDFGAHITRQYGERLLEDLDDVIATGNGTTQPEGITNKSGTTSVSFGGTTNLGNYESLRFGVPKNEHGPSVKASAIFLGTETSYQRARAISVGTADARRLGGMDYDSYMWMQRPYKINESLTNQQIGYAIMARYRMYRRKGFSVRTSTEGDTLIRNNEMLIVVMARYGGQLERGACAAVTTTAPA